MKIFCKKLCLILVFILLTQILPLTVFAAAELPQSDSVIYSDDFSDGVLDKRIVKIGGNGALEEYENALVLSRISTSVVGKNVMDGYQIYINEDKSASNEYFTAVSFYVSRNASQLFTFNVLDDKNQIITGLDFMPYDVVNARYKNELGEELNETVSNLDCTKNDVKVTYVFNNAQKTFSLWLNDTVALEDGKYIFENRKLDYFELKMSKRHSGTVSMKELEIYTYEVSDEESVAYEKAMLTFAAISGEKQESVTSNLNLFTEGKVGCDIQWTSSLPEVVSTEGRLNRSPDKDILVTLTAKITKGDFEETVSFDVTVKKFTATEMPEIKEIITELSEEKRVSEGGTYQYEIESPTGSILGAKFKVTSSGDYKVSISGRDKAVFVLENTDGELIVNDNSVKSGVPTSNEYTLLFDVITEKYSLWSGQDKIATMADLSDKISMAEILSYEQITGDGSISDFKVFYPTVPSEDAIVLDYEHLTFETMSYQKQTAVTTDLHLASMGRAGSEILWLSSNPGVITDDGLVNSSANGFTTLTAKLINGENTLTKSFDIDVAEHERYELPQVKNMILEDTFDNNDRNSLWQIDATGGDILVENEAMTMKRFDSTTTETMAILYMDEAKQVYNHKLFALEFTMTRDKENPPMVIIRQKGPNDFCAMDWLPGGNIRYVDGYTGQFVIDDKLVSTSRVKVTIFYDAIESYFSVYIDDKLILKNVKSRAQGHGIGQVNISMAGESLGTLRIDNIRFYETYLFSEERVPKDYEWLTENRLVSNTDEAYKYGAVSENLNLPLIGEYGSEISWTSSNENLISSEGVVNFSESGNEAVTLTAKIFKHETVLTKEFTFYPTRNITSSEEALKADADAINYDTIACYDNGSKEIVRNLNLNDTGIYGSKISWSSSDTKRITNSGRLIRPRWYEENAPVTMTATITNGENTITKDFDFMVVKDEEWKDPQYMSDEEFFGVWDGSKWTTPGKMNYEYKGLEVVGEAVKEGNIPLAKELLLNYYRTRPIKTSTSGTNRNPLWANALTDDFYHMNQGIIFQGEFVAKNDWEMCESKLRTDNINVGAFSCFGVRAWYNESSYCEIKRHNDPDISVRPRLEVTVNGAVRTYYAVDSYIVRAGKYADVNFNDVDVLKVQTYGDFLEDDTIHSVLKFDFSDLKSTDNVSAVKMVLCAKASPAYAGMKKMIVVLENTVEQTGAEATWSSTLGQVYNYNGLPDKMDWLTDPVGADTQYWHQNSRFYGYPDAIIPEYLATGDDTYIYKMLNNINDFIKDTGNYRLSTNTVVSKPDPNGIRGGYPNSLSALSKNNQWLKMIDIVARYERLTPELFTAMMKSIWDSATFLTTYPTPSGNWRQYEFNSLLNTSLRVPEFYDALAGTNWRKLGQDEMESMLFMNNMSDGTYIEPTSLYSVDMFNTSANYTATQGVTITDAFRIRLHRAAYYNGLLYTPDGNSLHYGDGSSGPRAPANFVNVARYHGDKELEYATTGGEGGEEPTWTSTHWSMGMTTVMRANWTKNSPYLFTNVRGGGQHAHSDYNGVIVYAYGRTLLNDAGSFSYGINDYRIWGTSTIGHNSVVINDTTQERGGVSVGYNPTGTIYDWTANSAFDYLSQSTPQTKGFNHRRTITFVKPTMWIVSDLMIPNMASNTNNYKQVWHMLPDSALSIDDESDTIRSNYMSGGNIIIANADGDNAKLTKAMGWYDMGYQQVTDSPYAYFEKTGKGNVTFDTVLIPTNNDPDATATAKKLETTENATALEIDFTLKDEKNTGYYYMSYDNKPGVFGKYSTDGQTAFVQENASGKIVYAMIKDGTYIKEESTGEYLIQSDIKLREFAVDMSGADIIITAGDKNDPIMANPDEKVADVFLLKGVSDDISTVKVRLGADKIVSNVKFNKEIVSYTIENGILKDIGNGTTTGNVTNENINVPSNGIVIAPLPGGDGGGGSSGGGGGSGGGGAGGYTEPGNPGTNAGFPDVSGHWSAVYANELKAKNILNGDDKGNFNPDNNITRAEFIAIIVRAMSFEQINYKNSFEDVYGNDWYSSVIQTALDNGLISPDTNFRPNDNITRQEMAKIISISAEKSGKFGDIQIKTPDFTDKETIHNWAKEYVDFAYTIGLISGMDDGSFKPLNNTTRGEAAAVISRLLSKV